MAHPPSPAALLVHPAFIVRRRTHLRCAAFIYPAIYPTSKIFSRHYISLSEIIVYSVSHFEHFAVLLEKKRDRFHRD
ncbi:hypothetical protein Dda3937_03805 [Dickeya dadantii 3937]|uniref:Uncharacterized protein n=1 Tax=Dickeya dadantii (strain 3937) TaxID=198628 RepID=E0SF30_DICD3|nr:hypothetical protein Dda3937_03805 [Dickeya dadantii 3937]